MASICNNEQVLFGVMSGHDRKILSLSVDQQAHAVARMVHDLADLSGRGKTVALEDRGFIEVTEDGSTFIKERLNSIG